MRLLTFNTLFKGDVRARLNALGAILESSDHDIVCLQEVMYRRGAQLIGQMAPALSYRVFTGAVLLRGGLLLLSRRPITSYRFEGYAPTRPLRPELLMRKGVQLATIGLRGGEVAVLNTHLSANRDDDWSPGNRYSRLQRRELRRLAGLVASIPATIPVVVTGDLNVPRESPLLAEFLAEAGLRDLRAGDREPTYRPTPSWPAPPALDHVLVRGLTGRSQLVFKEAVTLEGGRPAFLSDHYAIEADIEADPVR